MELKRRPARENDRAFVEGANAAAYKDVVIKQFGKWDAEVQSQLFGEKWQSASFEVVEAGGVPVGAIWSTDEGDHLWLREIFLLPAHQGQGIGSELVQQELAAARRAKKPMRLRVLQENRARVLYERLGLVVCGETDTHFWMETA